MSKNYENEVFSFKNDNVEDLTPDFSYDSISGLGESNYENEDLFKVEESSNDNSFENINYINEPVMDTFEQDYSTLNNGLATVDNFTNVELNEEYVNNKIKEYMENENFSSQPQNIDVESNVNDIFNTEVENSDNITFEELDDNISDTDNMDNLDSTEEEPIFEEPVFDEIEEQIDDSIVEVNEDSAPNKEEVLTESQTDFVEVEEEQPEVVEEQKREYFSDSQIEELNKVTDYETEEIETTDINALFDRVSINVQDASDIFRRNTEMKQKIDTRFDELKKLQSEVENSKRTQMDEINNYKEEVLNKLTEKKEEIEKRLNLLKDLQASFEKEKKEFEEYKRQEKEKIEQVQKEIQDAYDDRREELNKVEKSLREQKDLLDEERSQLSLDKIKYESDKNDLANNLLKFNELVNSFTNGVNSVEGN